MAVLRQRGNAEKDSQKERRPQPSPSPQTQLHKHFNQKYHKYIHQNGPPDEKQKHERNFYRSSSQSQPRPPPSLQALDQSPGGRRISLSKRSYGPLAAIFLCYCLGLGISCLAAAPSSSGQPQSVSSGRANGQSPSAGSEEVAQPMKDSNWLKGYEPSCDELRAMWRFSKRQSRASEMTNEIPTYRGDPFAMNMWQPNKPVLSQQSGMGMVKGRNPSRFVYDRSGKLMRTARPPGPIYGRVLHKEPTDLIDFGYPIQPQQQQQPRRIQYRFPGPSPPANAVVTRMSGSTPLNVTPQRGSFLKLKELVWTERARELAHQRRNEELQARAAVLKELANGGHGLSYQQEQTIPDGYNGGADYGGGDDESSYYESSIGGGGGAKLSHFRENSFLQQQQQPPPNSKINFPSKHSRLY